MATWRTLLEVIPPQMILRQRAHPHPWIQLLNGSEIVGRIADDADKLRGPSISWAWIDEWALCAAGTWKVVLGRLREGGGAGPAWTTSTPKQTRKRRENMREELERSSFRLFRARTRDNPHLHDDYISALERNYSGAYARQELEGEFVRFSAGIIYADWIRVESSPPEGLRWVRAWDPAFSERDRADRTAGILAAVDERGHLWLRDGIAYREGWPESRRRILETMRRDGPDVPVAIEAIASQQAAWQDLVTQPDAALYSVTPIRSDRDKLTRAQPWITRAQQGMVHVVDGPWVSDWLAEWEEFPDGEHDDTVDAVSIAWQALHGRVPGRVRVVERWGVPGTFDKPSTWPVEVAV
jgi:predicted phage terminase large subunit-like protein